MEEKSLSELCASAFLDLNSTLEYIEKLRRYRELGSKLINVISGREKIIIKSFNSCLDKVISLYNGLREVQQKTIDVIQDYIKGKDPFEGNPEEREKVIKDGREASARKLKAAILREKSEADFYKLLKNAPVSEKERMYYSTHIDEFIFRVYDLFKNEYLS